MCLDAIGAALVLLAFVEGADVPFHAGLVCGVGDTGTVE